MSLSSAYDTYLRLGTILLHLNDATHENIKLTKEFGVKEG
jgi:hypothetical protein